MGVAAWHPALDPRIDSTYNHPDRSAWCDGLSGNESTGGRPRTYGGQWVGIARKTGLPAEYVQKQFFAWCKLPVPANDPGLDVAAWEDLLELGRELKARERFTGSWLS